MKLFIIDHVILQVIKQIKINSSKFIKENSKADNFSFQQTTSVVEKSKRYIPNQEELAFIYTQDNPHLWGLHSILATYEMRGITDAWPKIRINAFTHCLHRILAVHNFILFYIFSFYTASKVRGLLERAL